MRIFSLFASRLILFVALSVADLVQTWRLLTRGWLSMYESNPVAARVLKEFGWAGLATYKVAATLLVAGAAAALWRRRPRVGARVLTFACLVLAGVVAYGSLLPGITRAFGGRALDDQAAAAEYARSLDQEFERLNGYQAKKEQLFQEVIAGRMSWADALDRFAEQAPTVDPVLLIGLRRTFRAVSDRDCVAANFARHALVMLQDRPALRQRFLRPLLTVYRARYHVPDPPPWYALRIGPGDAAGRTPPAP